MPHFRGAIVWAQSRHAAMQRDHVNAILSSVRAHRRQAGDRALVAPGATRASQGDAVGCGACGPSRPEPDPRAPVLTALPRPSRPIRVTLTLRGRAFDRRARNWIIGQACTAPVGQSVGNAGSPWASIESSWKSRHRPRAAGPAVLLVACRCSPAVHRPSRT